jgi:hypothetical protein
MEGEKTWLFRIIFSKVSLLAILVARLFKLYIENINWLLFLLRKPIFLYEK